MDSADSRRLCNSLIYMENVYDSSMIYISAVPDKDKMKDKPA